MITVAEGHYIHGLEITRGDIVETAVMARLKGAKGQAKKAQPAVARPTALTIKGNLEWREWVEQGAKHCRTDVAKLVDAALVDYLKGRGFEREAPER
jgi:hypothetical protein